VMTKDWKYIAVRYPAETIDAIRRATPDRLPQLMAYIGRMGIGTRGAEHPGFWDADQLYDLRADPGELTNLAANPRYAGQLQSLRESLTASIQSIGRPFGEFLPGGNAAPPGQVDAQIALVKQMDVQGKSVSVPQEAADPAVDSPPSQMKKGLRKKGKAIR
jgi:arylsulfatase A-like enzyme